jgi:predicted nucleic acid-binding protein
MNGFRNLGITVLRISEDIEETACDLFRTYDLPRLSYTDCTSFALINAHHISHVFTFDEHFRIIRFNHSVIVL